eukprot:CAMPEP_0114053734 /NCGR_PEP_ID=MMETSP1339-20121228/82172_1 /TAXON_ID=94617 /ORGANISM="Fibrocapsa japonica" /LENGTH=47 /assembly_acc=CAM_ASM_000762
MKSDEGSTAKSGHRSAGQDDATPMKQKNDSVADAAANAGKGNDLVRT